MNLSILFSFLLSLFSHEKKSMPISCGTKVENVQRATITSAQSGNWSNPATWTGGVIPSASDLPKISAGHTVNADTSVTVAGIQIEGKLAFVPNKSVTLQSTQNIVVTGTLEALTPNSSIIQTIRFININEKNFVGSGMDVVASDVGLWVMGSGRLNFQGAYKTPYINANGDITANSTSITLKTAPVNWSANDELTVSPTTYNSRLFDETKVASISSTTLTVSPAISHVHSKINNKWTAEIINLTRNIRIEGTATGQTHVFIRSTVAQTILNVQLRYVGPRNQQSGTAETEFVIGRYALHFHHCMDGSVGSLVDGCVVRDAGSHAYVPHVSNGITMSHNVAYKCLETPFWWDIPDPSNNTSWIGNIVAAPNFIPRSISFDTKGSPTLGVHGFIFGMGDGNKADSNVVVGQIGLETVNAAFDWEEMDVESAWEFKENLAHNCDAGIRSWQNNGKNHVLTNSVVYNSNVGAFHGAYANNYTYDGGEFYASEFQIHSAGQENAVRLQNIVFNGAKLIDYPVHMVDGPIAGTRPIFVYNSIFRGGIKGHLWDESNDKLKNIDLIGCIISKDSILVNPNANEIVRVQPALGQSYQVKKSGTTNIQPFAPAIYGTGNGLRGDYYNNTDFTSIAFTRIEPIILFQEWQTPVPGNATGVHYSITDLTYSIRYTGLVQPQYSENYIFKLSTGGGVRMWVNNVQIINSWDEPYPTVKTSSAIALIAGQKYAIKIEYLNTDDRSNLSLYWQSTTQAQQIIPQSQLYSDSTLTPNTAPTANAGNDIAIQLPTNSVSLSGSASSDIDGTIASYSWTKVSGGSATIASPTSVNTSITGLAAGTYVFRLTVTDNRGATSSDDVQVVVKTTNAAPVADAGSNETITLSFALNGNGTDSDGTIASYLWEKVSGPTCTITAPSQRQTTVTNISTVGTYVFRLTVTDNQGATNTATVTKIVQ